MKNIYILFTLSILLTACTEKETDISAIIAKNDLSAMQTKKAEILAAQQKTTTQLAQLNAAIDKFDRSKKLPLVTTLAVKEQSFKHYIELQGNVTTKQLLMLYPEYSGIISDIYVTEGQYVKKGQLLAQIDDGGLAQQLSALQIQADLAKITFEKQTRLWEQKIGSEMQFLQVKSAYNAQQKAVSQLKKQLQKTTIVAPFSGTIDAVIAKKGSVVAAGQSQIIRILNLNNMYVKTTVPEKHIAHLKKGKEVLVSIPVLGKTQNAKIDKVSAFINPANRTFEIEIPIKNSAKEIKPNLTAKLKINDYSNTTALLIPQSVLSENAQGTQYLYQIKTNTDTKNNHVEKVFVTTGKTQDGLVEILKGLTPGAQIIVEGARNIKDGQEVTIIAHK